MSLFNFIIVNKLLNSWGRDVGYLKYMYELATLSCYVTACGHVCIQLCLRHVSIKAIHSSCLSFNHTWRSRAETQQEL